MISSLGDAVPGHLDQAIINDGFVVKYDTAAATNVGSLIVGADWPVTGDFGTPGTLNMSAGSIEVNGGGNAFQVGRACCGRTVASEPDRRCRVDD